MSKRKLVAMGLLCSLISCGPVEEESMDREAQGAATPKMSELTAYGGVLPDTFCKAAQEDGLWCGSDIGGDAKTVYLCGGGKTYEKMACTKSCVSGGYQSGYNMAGVLGRLSYDYCASDSQAILISLSQQRLRACDSAGNKVLEHDISTGKPGYETWNPMGMSNIYNFTIGARVLVERMISPYGPNDYYDARVPWSMNLVANGTNPTGEYLHASGSCAHCGDLTNAPAGHSHGCVNQSYINARRLFMWTPAGTRVKLTKGDLPATGCTATVEPPPLVTAKCSVDSKGHRVHTCYGPSACNPSTGTKIECCGEGFYKNGTWVPDTGSCSCKGSIITAGTICPQ
jgi:hypothetical protein